MIYVRMEMWPGGNQKKKYLLGELLIRNNGTGTRTRGSYYFAVSKRGGFGKGSCLPAFETTNDLTWGNVANFPRKAKLAWDLLRLVLEVARS